MTRAMAGYLRGDLPTPFCPGCGHGILMGAILRAVDASPIPIEQFLFVSGIGCAAWIPSPHFKADTLHTLHGRAIPFATGAKLANSDLHVVVISGDGDLAAIGGNHLIHAARRNTNLTVICANNQVFGMTGGQTAPTTPTNAMTATEKNGAKERPFDLCRLVLAAGAEYVARYPVTRPIELMNAVRRGIDTDGFAFIEALSPCPTHFGHKNRYEDIADLYEAMDQSCVDGLTASDMDRNALKGRIVVGELGE